MRILLIEDEPELLHDLARGLALKGYAVDEAADGAEGLQRALDEDYDLVVLDLNLPGMDGLRVLSELRAVKPQAKALILSANHHLETKLSGFALGASDYLTKPFHFEELEARIRVLINRQFVQQTTTLTYRDLSLDTLKRQAHACGEPLSLTAKEMGILEYFLLNQGRLVTQQDIVDHVWDGDANPFSNSVRVHLSALRKKLKAALGADPIRTKIGEGYLLP
ncbi:response regulator transcription factor [Adlercreutzia muris]|uniref:response regulator transcription factor n=1 Tax=Adlercreutzia muris TaxID=1796610 RepID=UPI0035147E0F